MLRITSPLEFHRTGSLRGGEREGDEACPIVDHRDLGVDVEATAALPLTGTENVFVAFYLQHNICICGSLCTTLKIVLLHVCVHVCVSEECLFLCNSLVYF